MGCRVVSRVEKRGQVGGKEGGHSSRFRGKKVGDEQYPGCLTVLFDPAWLTD